MLPQQSHRQGNEAVSYVRINNEKHMALDKFIDKKFIDFRVKKKKRKTMIKEKRKVKVICTLIVWLYFFRY